MHEILHEHLCWRHRHHFPQYWKEVLIFIHIDHIDHIEKRCFFWQNLGPSNGRASALFEVKKWKRTLRSWTEVMESTYEIKQHSALSPS